MFVSNTNQLDQQPSLFNNIYNNIESNIVYIYYIYNSLDYN